jgi:glycosyltransferase involved in cell wall biosynthesis
VPKQEVRDYYALADVCLVPLRDIPLFETFLPSRMFEVMAMSRPILASLRGEAAGILDKSGGAMVVAPEDSGAIAGAIRELFLNPPLAAALGQRGRQFVIDNYSRQALARQYIQVIEDACRDYHGVKAAP